MYKENHELTVCLQEPQAPDPWKDVRDAQTEKPVAPQIDIFMGKGYQGDEDCLFLNVYTPKVAHQFFRLDQWNCSGGRLFQFSCLCVRLC
jgi:hypothetical protein